MERQRVCALSGGTNQTSNVTVQAFGHQKSIYSSDCWTNESRLRQESAFTLKLFGIPVFSGNDTGLREIRVAINNEKAYQLSLFTDVLNLPRKPSLPIGPVTVVFDAGLVATFGLEYEIKQSQYLAETCDESGLKLDTRHVLRPYARAAAYGSVGIDVYIGEVGVQVDANLIKFSAPLSHVKQVHNTGSTGTGQASVHNRFDIEVETLSGAISGYIQTVDIPVIGSLRESVQVFNWDGFKEVIPVFDPTKHNASYAAFENRMSELPDDLH